MKKILLAAALAATSRTLNDPDNTDNRRFAIFYDDKVDIGFRTVGDRIIDMDAKRCEPDGILSAIIKSRQNIS